MTYCVGILVKDGLVMIADTRTNAGLDNISTFRKLHLFEVPGERVVAVSSAGNLAAAQAVVQLVSEGFDGDYGTETLYTVPSMFAAAQLVGRAVQHVFKADGASMEAMSARFDVMLLVGGQIGGGRLRLFQVYSAGNFIKSTTDTPYLQIGEHKYGKPILDRAVNFDTDLNDALKLGLISMDSTMRSNLGVGMPIDMMTVRRDALETEVVHRIDQNDSYFSGLRESWSNALSQAHRNIPRPPYEGRDTEID
ncbi:peptidase [Tepidamorphus sp. 3E244]|uniref:peptidase n=1 Tax=Tepidamorphus sp. 3E244 TaxID=3385498 RepID=UPI0038FD15BA